MRAEAYAVHAAAAMGRLRFTVRVGPATGDEDVRLHACCVRSSDSHYLRMQEGVRRGAHYDWHRT